uniref:Membrane-associated kinase regulator 6 n=1 Tax=Gongylonema pulchrum TaxID=637853 RepID=A0A183EB02_9BILA
LNSERGKHENFLGSRIFFHIPTTDFSIRDTISNGTAKFFGVPPPEDRQSPSVGSAADPKWSSRRLRYICKPLDDLIDIPSPSKSITPQDEVNATEFTVNFSKTYFAKFSLNYYQNAVVDVIQNAHFPGNPNPVKSHQVPRSKSIESRNSRIHPHLERRDSVMKMAYERFSTIIQWGTFRPKKAGGVKRGRSSSSSFSPFSIQQTGNVTQIKIGPTVLDNDLEREATRVPVSSGIAGGRISSKDRASLPLTMSSSESLQDEVFFDVTPTSVAPFSISSVERGTNVLLGEQQAYPIYVHRFGPPRTSRRLPVATTTMKDEVWRCLYAF